jgi:endonuclease YncB( thermonuclease family)
LAAAGLAFTLGILADRVVRTEPSQASSPALTEEKAPSPARPVESGPTRYPAQVLRVIDGDTFEARVAVWPGLDVTTKVRLRGVDAPEMRAQCDAEHVQAEAARDALSAMLAKGEVTISTVSLDKHGGRVLAAASARGTPDVSGALLAARVARPYSGGRRDGWCGGLVARD